MQTNKFGEIVLDQNDLCDLIMQGQDVTALPGITVDREIDIQRLVQDIQDPGALLLWTFPEDSDIAIPEFDEKRQGHWFMPDEYKTMDIAQYVLDRCGTQEQLQRAGAELMMYQERGLFDLLRYLKYLVDVMKQNQVVWGVGRGSSVASYVLYLIGIHKVDSMYYNLDPAEFLR